MVKKLEDDEEVRYLVRSVNALGLRTSAKEVADIIRRIRPGRSYTDTVVREKVAERISLNRGKKLLTYADTGNMFRLGLVKDEDTGMVPIKVWKRYKKIISEESCRSAKIREELEEVYQTAPDQLAHKLHISYETAEYLRGTLKDCIHNLK